MAHVVVKDLFKRYGEFQAVHGINFEIGDGEFVVLVGPSGCGKSTILRMIAGLETVTGGEILIDGEVVNDTPPRERDIAMVFQDYALYPHMSVRQNLGFGLKMRGTARDRDQSRRRAHCRDPADRGTARPQAEGAFGRTTSARGNRSRDRARASALPLRRAPLQSRCSAARRDAHADQTTAHEFSGDQRLCHPRPNRGDDAGRPHRRSSERHHRAGGHAGAALRQARQSFCRRVHRFAEDELPGRKAPAGKRRAVRNSGRRAGDKIADPQSAQCTGRSGNRHRHSPRAPHR